MEESKRVDPGNQKQPEITLLRAIVRDAVDGIIVIDEQGRVRLMNPAAERLFGYRRKEVLGRNITLLMPEPYRSQHDQYLRRYLETGEQRIIGIGREVAGRRKDGSVFPMHLSVAEIHYRRQRAFVGIVHDLTETKRTEERLLWLSRALEQIPLAVVITDAEGTIRYVNPRFTQLTGYPAEEVIGKNPRLLQSGKTQLAIYQRLWKTILSGQEWQGEILNRRKNGELYWAREHIAAIKDPQGKITHFIAVQEDITERKQVEDALSKSEERFRQIAKLTGEWIWEQDSSGRYTYCSAAVEEILGYAPEEIVGKHYYELFTPENRKHWATQVPPVSTIKQRFFRILNHYRHQDGHEVITQSSGAPIFDEQGRLTGWRGVDRDITKQLEAEAMIRQTQVKLAVARNELKLARQIQKSLLPSSPLKLPAVHVTGYCLPAAQVGGDYFDYFQRRKQIDVVIADVSGHAVGSALFMVETRSALKTQLGLERTVADTLALLNEALFEDLNRADHFITMFYLRYHTATRQLSYASAGHNPPLLLRQRQADCVQLDAEGLIFGVKREVAFEEKTTLLEPGDIVFLYTDGLIEAESEQGEFFGSERLCNLLTRHRQATPQGLIDLVIAELHDFCGSAVFQDDVTVVVLKAL